MNNEAIVSSIKQLCKNNNITVTQLEKEVGMSQGLVSKWKDKVPSLDKIIDIADYFHVTLDEVVGRCSSQCEDDIVSNLIKMTANKEIQWKFIEEYKSQNICDKTYYDLFCLWVGEEIEIFKCQYDNSFLFVVAQYDVDQGLFENLEIQLYIQPDKDSIPVVQENLEENIENLWIKIREPYKGIPDEWKASVIRKRITGQIVHEDTPKRYIENDTADNLDETLNKVQMQLNTPEMQKTIDFLQSDSFKSIQKVLSNKELLDSILYISKKIM